MRSANVSLVALAVAAGLWTIGQAAPTAAQDQQAAGLPARGTPAATDIIPCQPVGSTLKACTVGALEGAATVGAVVVTAYGAACDGLTDDHVAVAAAIAVLPPRGGVVVFPAATCYLGTAGIVIARNGIHLLGQGGSALGGVGTILTYGGTGAAITIGQQGALNYNDAIDQLQIMATGSATTSSTARGLELDNSQYFVSHNIGVTYFGAGVGVLAQGNGSICGGQCFTANNTFYDANIYANFVGVRSAVVNGGVGENILGFHGGWSIGAGSSPVAGSIGFDIQSASAGGVVENLDSETYATCVKIAGQGWRFTSSHTEFCTQHINLTSSSNHNIFTAHVPASVGSFAAIWADAGADNHFYGSSSGGSTNFIGKNTIRPSFDACEVLNIVGATGTSYFDLCTSGSPNIALPNGVALYGYSGNFTDQTWSILSSSGLANFVSETLGSLTVNGSATSQSLTVNCATSGTNFIAVNDNNGHPIFGSYCGGTRASDSVTFSTLVGCVQDACSTNGLVLSAVQGTITQQIQTDGAARTVSNAEGTVVETLTTSSTAAASTLAFAGRVGAVGLVTAPVAYASLPASPAAGTRAAVSNTAVCTFGTAVNGSGSTFCAVIYNGSAWVGE
jgi:hypothetical protein